MDILKSLSRIDTNANKSRNQCEHRLKNFKTKNDNKMLNLLEGFR